MQKFQSLKKIALLLFLITSTATIVNAETNTTNTSKSVTSTHVTENNSTNKLIPPRLHIVGYNMSLTDIYNQLVNNYQNDKSSTLLSVTSNYIDFLSQVSGLAYDSNLYNGLKYFKQGFLARMEANKSNTSLFYQFAKDIKVEEQNFMSSPTESGYPDIPKTNRFGNYGTYRSQLVNIFVESIQQRLQDYYLPNFQNKYFYISADRHEVPQLTNEASMLVRNYITIVKLLTNHALTCDYLNTEIQRANCFRNYMQLITEFPSVLASNYYLNSKEKPLEYKPTEEQLESIINPIFNYYKNYATIPTLIAVPIINK